jgi:hypothetical protein
MFATGNRLESDALKLNVYGAYKPGDCFICMLGRVIARDHEGHAISGAAGRLDGIRDVFMHG